MMSVLLDASHRNIEISRIHLLWLKDHRDVGLKTLQEQCATN